MGRFLKIRNRVFMTDWWVPGLSPGAEGGRLFHPSSTSRVPLRKHGVRFAALKRTENKVLRLIFYFLPVLGQLNELSLNNLNF